MSDLNSASEKVSRVQVTDENSCSWDVIITVVVKSSGGSKMNLAGEKRFTALCLLSVRSYSEKVHFVGTSCLTRRSEAPRRSYQ